MRDKPPHGTVANSSLEQGGTRHGGQQGTSTLALHRVTSCTTHIALSLSFSGDRACMIKLSFANRLCTRHEHESSRASTFQCMKQSLNKANRTMDPTLEVKISSTCSMLKPPVVS